MANVEAGDASVSIDLIFKLAVAAGAKRSEVAQAIRSTPVLATR
jgi:hypothetical protein